jgi:DNA-binding LacI/PurR family transcriptional regulator
VGRIAAELLHAEIDGGAAAVPEKVYLQAELVARASSAAPADRTSSLRGPPDDAP